MVDGRSGRADSATQQILPEDAKPRAVLRLMLAGWMRLETPPHAVVATGLELLQGGPRRLAHGVFSSLVRRCDLARSADLARTRDGALGRRGAAMAGAGGAAAAGLSVKPDGAAPEGLSDARPCAPVARRCGGKPARLCGMVGAGSGGFNPARLIGAGRGVFWMFAPRRGQDDATGRRRVGCDGAGSSAKRIERMGAIWTAPG
jgi:16S rRNA (cytosine967-C5)-methyltransferase